MAKSSPNKQNNQIRIYDRADSVVFLKTKESFGGLSNMAGGFPLLVNGIRILTSEALYQACRFPHRPDVQRLIIGENSPMTAKMKSKPYRHDSRPDWDMVRVKIMRWCLRVKLAQNWDAFSKLLLQTGERPIVEQSRKDDFWGAKPTDERTLIGINVLGRLLMELREEVKSKNKESLLLVEPTAIPNFFLDGNPISAVSAENVKKPKYIYGISEKEKPSVITPDRPLQASFFEPHTVNEAVSDYLEADHVLLTRPIVSDRYPNMKESGVPWLGKIPEHWKVLPNRAIFMEVKERNHPDEKMLSVTINKGIIRQRTLLTDSSKKDSSNLDKSAYKLVHKGDIAYNKMRAWQGALGASIFRGIISPAYVVMRPRDKVNSRFYHYLYRTPAFAKEAERWSYGITSDMWSLRPEHFKVIYSVLSPLVEQAAIVRFLDHANRKIDHFIRTKKKMIGLLKEQKQAIIHHAVTRGLNPDASLKPSGIPWLGDIPKHWEVRKIKSLVSTYGGMTPSKGNAAFWEGSIPWVSPKDMKVREITDSTDHISNAALHQSGITLIPHPAVLIVVRGMILARTFPTAITAVPVTVNQDMKALLPKPGLNPEYFVSLLTGIQRDLLLLVEIAGHGTCCLRTDSWGSFTIPLPPLTEQEEIEAYLKERLSIQTIAITCTDREISLIQEYRTRLTADIVTGKLDVREAAARLPEEIEEPETIDESEALAEDYIEDEDLE